MSIAAELVATNINAMLFFCTILIIVSLGGIMAFARMLLTILSLAVGSFMLFVVMTAIASKT